MAEIYARHEPHITADVFGCACFNYYKVGGDTAIQVENNDIIF